MSLAGRVTILSSAPATQFIAAAALNVGMNEAIWANELSTLGRGRVVRVTIRSAENKLFDVAFYASNAYATGAVTTTKFLGKVSFILADGVQVAGAGPFLYSAACDIPVRDENQASKVYVSIINRSAVALVGGANTLALELAVDQTSGGA